MVFWLSRRKCIIVVALDRNYIAPAQRISQTDIEPSENIKIALKDFSPQSALGCSSGKAISCLQHETIGYAVRKSN